MSFLCHQVVIENTLSPNSKRFKITKRQVQVAFEVPTQLKLIWEEPMLPPL